VVRMESVEEGETRVPVGLKRSASKI
jgi:hypothetical protein